MKCLMMMILLVLGCSTLDTGEQSGVTVETENVIKAEVRLKNGAPAALARVRMIGSSDSNSQSFADTGTVYEVLATEEGRFILRVPGNAVYFLKIAVEHENSVEVYWSRYLNVNDGTEMQLGQLHLEESVNLWSENRGVDSLGIAGTREIAYPDEEGALLLMNVPVSLNEVIWYQENEVHAWEEMGLLPGWVHLDLDEKTLSYEKPKLEETDSTKDDSIEGQVDENYQSKIKDKTNEFYTKCVDDWLDSSYCTLQKEELDSCLVTQYTEESSEENEDLGKELLGETYCLEQLEGAVSFWGQRFEKDCLSKGGESESCEERRKGFEDCSELHVSNKSSYEALDTYCKSIS